MNRHVLFLFVLLCCFACNTGKDQQRTLHTAMGDIRVTLAGNAPALNRYFLQLSDTLRFDQVIRDQYIRFGAAQKSGSFQVATVMPLLSGALAAAPDGRLLIIQGAPQSDATLDAAEKQRKLVFTPAERAAYKQYGGYPKGHGLYTPFGRVTNGAEVVDRLAALPHDAEGGPLEPVWVLPQ